MTEGTSTSGATAATETAGPVAAVAATAASAAAPAPAPVDAHVAAMAAAAATTAAPSVPAAPPAAPAVGPTAAAIAAAETAAAIEAAAAKKADKAEKSDSDSDETSMSDAEMLAEVELASLGDAGAAIGQDGLPCGVLPVVDAPVAAAPPPVVVPVGDSGMAFSPVLLGLLGLGALGLGYLLLRDDDDDDDVDVPVDENDPPVAADEAINVDEDAAEVSGQLDATDPDGDSLTYDLDTDVAGLTVNADGSYTFDVAAAGLDNLADGETETITTTYTVSDGEETDTGTITITVTGVNVAPVLTGPVVADVDENMPAGTVVFDVDATDADGDDIVFSLEGDDAGSFTIDPVTGEVTTTAVLDFETQETYNITVVATDESGATDSQEVVVSVNDLPEVVVQSLDIDNDANTLTPFVFDAGDEWYQFMDDDDIANNIELINFGAEDYIVFDAPFSDIAFAAIDTLDGDGLNDLLITINNGGTVTEILIEDVADDGVFVFDEASAEAAVAGDNTFRTTGETGAMISLDADDDADVSTSNIIDAGGGNITYYDDADIANNTTITGFDDGDLITTNADGTLVMATFSNIGDADEDGFGDLMITINNDGVLSMTILEDAIAADAVVTNEATAEAAIGFDFFSYA